MAKDERKPITECITTSVYEDILDCPLADVEKRILENVNRANTKEHKYENLHLKETYDYGEYGLAVYGTRLETDAERDKRLKKREASRKANAAKKAKKEAAERAQYERLKAKYEGET